MLVSPLKMDMISMYVNSNALYMGALYVQKWQADLLVGFQEKTYV